MFIEDGGDRVLSLQLSWSMHFHRLSSLRDCGWRGQNKGLHIGEKTPRNS